MHVEHGASGFSDNVLVMLPRIERAMPTIQTACANLEMVNQYAQGDWDKYAMLIGLLAQHDTLTMAHTEQVVAYTQSMLGIIEELAHEQSETYDAMYKRIMSCEPVMGAALHDIGKLFVPRYILNRREKNNITPEEHDLLVSHGCMGRIIAEHLDLPQSLIPFLEKHYFHSQPEGLSGVPDDSYEALSVVALADVASAIMISRPYNTYLDPLQTVYRQVTDLIDDGVFPQSLRTPFERFYTHLASDNAIKSTEAVV
ncbi:MAG: hypothetical protein WC489_06630 [Patescibacteria group bacterium]